MIIELLTQLAEAELILLKMFEQGCQLDLGGPYNHHHISAYEHAQAYLLRHKIITPEQCVYDGEVTEL